MNLKQYLLLILITFISSWSFCQSPTACDRASDSLELVKIYQNLKGVFWNDHTNWLVPGKPISSWKGVVLNSSGCVEQLLLDSNYVEGILYEFNLSNLRTLSLKSNQLTGTIPDYSKLTNLNTLDLSYNQLSGQIPNFSYFSKLVNLYLNFNLLSGSIPDFNKLLSLKILDFSDNQLTGQLPDFSRLSKLTELVLAFNSLTGSIPNFSKLPNLKVLVVHGNKLSGTIPDFTNLPNLTNLLAAFNQLSGPVPNFSNFTNIYQLSLADNQLTGTIPDFSNMPGLGIIYLSYNKLTGMIPNFTNLQNLYVMNFAHNDITGEIPEFTNIPWLNWLVLSGNQLSGVIPDYNSSKIILTQMELDNNLLSGPIPNYPNLSSFFVFNNKFTFTDILSSNNIGIIQEFYYAPQKPFYKDTVIRIVKNNPVTIDLGIDSTLTDNLYIWYKDSVYWFPPVPNDLHSNKLIFLNPEATDAGRYYSSVINFRAPYLNLHSHTISLSVCDEQKDSLELVKLYTATNGANWKNNNNWLQAGKRINSWYGVTADAFGCARKLDLTDNNLKGTLPILEMNTLDTLILRKNSLAGAIPEINTPFMKYFDLGTNQLEGDFPKSIKKWYDLNGLDLSFNGISGAVPPDLGDLCELTTLRINNNNISGELPEQLTMLVKLQKGKVNFSNNKIDSLKDKLIWFCPFGDTILQINPSYDRFLGICNVQCSGNEFKNLKDFNWIIDSVYHLNCNDANCALTTAQAGLVDVRGITVFYTLSRCYLSLGPPPVFTDVIHFYDCGGHLLETVINDIDTFYSEHGAIIKEDFDSLKYDIKWQCGQTLDIGTSTIDPVPEKKYISSGVLALHCSPNPANALLTCEVNEKVVHESLQMFDLLGKQYNLKTQLQKDQIQFDVSNLPRGIYFISIQGKEGRYLGKVVVE